MKPLTAIEMASFKINALPQEERTRFYRNAIRNAHAARADAVRELFGIAAKRLERHPLVMRALIDSAVALVLVIAFVATMPEPISNRIVSIGHVSSGLPLLW